MACGGARGSADFDRIGQATAWPTRPVRFIVPFPPGGTVDPLARLLGTRLSTDARPAVHRRQPARRLRLDRGRPGGEGGPRRLHLPLRLRHARGQSVADPNLPFDTVKDLAPVMLVGTAPMAIATAPGKPYKTFADIIKLAKAKPGSITYGSVGSGSLGHLTMTLVQEAGGFKLVHVPFKGGGPMTTDMLGGHVELGIGSVAVLAPHINGGKLRAIASRATNARRRCPMSRHSAEQGFPGFSALAWWGIFAPAGAQDHARQVPRRARQSAQPARICASN